MKIFFSLTALLPVLAFCQTAVSDSLVIRSFYTLALEKEQAYADLQKLCAEAPGRLSGSENLEKAIEITAQMLREAGADTVYLQPVMVPHWERGTQNVAWWEEDSGDKELHVTALGGSVGTGPGGISAQVIEVTRISQLDSLGYEKLNGKIVFFNRPMNAAKINTFDAYGSCADQRLNGSFEAAKYGAVAVLTRSLSLSTDKHPHTGTLLNKGEYKIPGAAISTEDANLLSELIKKNPEGKVRLLLDCKTYADAQSYNVVGEITGRTYPNEIIAFGGHIDSWDLSQGAHDDGAGCVHAIEVIRLFKQAQVNPERTLRCVLWVNEENGARGAEKYAALAKENNEKHLVAIESDRGGFTPLGFSIDGEETPRNAALSRMKSWEPLFYPYYVQYFDLGGSGVDVSRLRDQGAALVGFIPDSQRYFDFHHAETDNIEHVHPRELELGAASIAALVYLFDRYGLYD